MPDIGDSTPAGKKVTLQDGPPSGLRSRGIPTAGADGAEIAAVAGGKRVGCAAYTRLYGPRAELTLDVDDGFWHRGVPEVLLDAVVAHAAGDGISTLLARVHAVDLRLLALLRERVQGRTTRDGAHVRVEFAVAPQATRP